MISWARRGLRGRRGTSVGGGPDGAPEETTHPACCKMAPQRETIRARARWQPSSWPRWALHPLWVWRCVKQTTARGRGQSQSPITLQRLKPPEKGCHPIRCHSHRTRSCRSQPQRDADRVGWRGQVNALSVVMARHVGIKPAWARLSPAARFLCPAVFSSQVPGSKKMAGRKGRSRSLKRKQEVLIHFNGGSRQILASAKSQRRRIFVAEEKKSEMRRRSDRLYRQTPLPFWQAMAGYIAIGSRTAAEPLVCFLVLHEPMDVQFHCVIIKMLQLKRKKLFFPYKHLRRSTSEISKGNMYSPSCCSKLIRLSF